MRGLDLDEVRLGAAYNAVRAEAQHRLADLKRDRRIALGGMTLVFENRVTILAALEESLRAERIIDRDAAGVELADFATLLPRPDELVACVYVNAADQAELGTTLADLAGATETLYLEIDGSRVNSVDVEAAVDEAAAAVSLVRFRIDPAQRRALDAGAQVTVGIDHPRSRARAVLGDGERQALTADLAG